MPTVRRSAPCLPVARRASSELCRRASWSAGAVRADRPRSDRARPAARHRHGRTASGAAPPAAPARSRRRRSARAHGRTVRGRAPRPARCARSAPREAPSQCPWRYGRRAPRRPTKTPPCGEAPRALLACGAEARRGRPVLEFDAVGFLNEPLVAADAFVGGAERRARHNRVEVDVGRSDIRMFRQVQPEVRIAGRFDGARDKRHHGAHRHSRVGIVQRRLVETRQGKKWRRIVPQGPEAGNQRVHRANGQERLRAGHRVVS